MTTYSLADDSGELLPFSRHLLDVLAFFPDDDLSHHALRYILKLEYEKWRTLGADQYQASHVTSVLMTDAANRSQQVWVSGLVALAMFAQHAQGKKPSQKTAVEQVCAYTAKQNKHDFVFFDSGRGEFSVKGVRMQSDPASVRKLFKKYRSAANVCAARVVRASYLEPLPPFQEARVADRCYLATVVAFQNIFEHQMGMRDWGIRLVAAPPGLQDDSAPLPPPAALMDDLMGKSA